jgi:hypothetical protein
MMMMTMVVVVMMATCSLLMMSRLLLVPTELGRCACAQPDVWGCCRIEGAMQEAGAAAGAGVHHILPLTLLL